MPPRRRRPEPEALAAALADVEAGDPARASLKLLVKHYLDELVEAAPGYSVEVRVPPYGAVQAVAGGRHTRGTPRAVVETDALTWIALARGGLTWDDAVGTHRIAASGERTDLAPYLPLTGPRAGSGPA
ncbi:sterol carrier family protein [Nocardioides sp. CFH 31398]|uniref:sterol carrier family protein n=1 Tax=Nocardioides sp. CFH 31398 TaxID=2919579 RepID=UPI001F056211|nr:sterol carrier family protein [Nocardioides sp. CFH 31398]MCH1866114.1 sterol carrier family protein [Nocardioides sp. CFH 31398]